MKTNEEILKRFNERKLNDFFGFECSDYLSYLDFEHVKPFLKNDVTPDQWNPDSQESEKVIAKILDYMPFAWEKANNCRGISSSRSISHFIAWTWMIDEKLSAEIDRMFDQEYQHYGKEILVMICDHYGWDYSQWDNGKRVNSEDEE